MSRPSSSKKKSKQLVTRKLRRLYNKSQICKQDSIRAARRGWGAGKIKG